MSAHMAARMPVTLAPASAPKAGSEPRITLQSALARNAALSKPMRSTRAGLPCTTAPAGMLLVSTVPGRTVAPSPMVMLP